MQKLPSGCGFRIEEPSVSWRCGEDLKDRVRPWNEVLARQLRSAVPWRNFRWVHGQRHYSGTYWSSTTEGFVIYESRLELARLLVADFDDRVEHIVAQPFLMTARIDGKLRRHVPDYLLFTTDGPVVIDVKPRRKLDAPKVAYTLAWAREMIESHGWVFEVATEPAPTLLENIRFLAGYRRQWLIDPQILACLRAQRHHGRSLADTVNSVQGVAAISVKPAVLHMLWTHELSTDLTRRLSGRSEISASA
ncbi:TnsA-like heteromeric transposase endonuclease subunit [Mycobacteroides abscessus]|uniref:TnsA-like heteromeric transposase endonuclease subunit n=1 Tax=Mycobacteroides abscessus TaxID=36809 RepID=UPI001F244D89|nr:TnsA-like heteromeric transposase endonuclease subunit [Mycobacteroides abscessus]